MDDNHKPKHSRIVPALLTAVLFLALLTLFACAAAVIMKPFGLRYESFSGFVLYFLFASLLSWPPGLLVTALPKYLSATNQVSRLHAALLYAPLDLFVTAAGFHAADFLMASVSAGSSAIAVISVLIALLGSAVEFAGKS